jgi:hypothetical protein
MKKKKGLFAIPIISGIFLAIMWSGPHLHTFDLSIKDGDVKGSIELSKEDHEEESTEDVENHDWQRNITWGIGALNGLLGIALISKKILNK